MRFSGPIVLIAVVCVVLLEIALRILAAFPNDSDLFVNDADVGYRMRPHTRMPSGLKLNSFGFNDIEHDLRKESGSVRAAVIGDSFVFGAVPRSENFTHVLQDFADASGLDVEILNMGIPAAEPNNYLALLRNDVVLMDVDAVYVVFFVGNDIIQSHPDFQTVVWMGATREVLRRPHLVGPSMEYSYVYRTLRSVSRLVNERLDDTSRESYNKENFLAIEYQRSPIYRIDRDSYIRESYRGAKGILRKIAAEAKRLGKEICFVLAPDELQVNDELRRALIREYDLDEDDYDFSLPQGMLAKALREAGLDVIDLLPVFREAGRSETLYKERDTHWNSVGNRLAAEVLFSHLKRNLDRRSVP